MDVKEVSEYTKLSQQTIYNLVCTKKIPHKRISARKVVFDEEKIARWMRKRENKKDKKAKLSLILLAVFSKKRIAYSLGALVIFALGCLSGFNYYRNHSRLPEKMAAGEPLDIKSLVDNQKIVGVDFKMISLNEDKVDVKLNYLSDRELQDTVSSNRMKPLLEYALFNAKGEYAEKAKTIDIVTKYTADPDIKKMLLRVMTFDKNAAIRMKAVTVLSRIIHDRDVKKAFLQRMENEENEIVRFKILDVIAKIIDQDVLKTMERIKDKDTDKIIKSRIENLIKAFKA